MDQISLLFAAMLASVSQMASQHSVPPASTLPPTIAVQTVKIPPPPMASKSEHACADYGKPDAAGNLNYFCHN